MVYNVSSRGAGIGRKSKDLLMSNVMMAHFNSRCHRQWRREGGRGGASGGGPGQAGFFFFFIGSQWGIQDFDKGGPRKNNLASLRSA